MNLALAYEPPSPEPPSASPRFNAYLLNVEFAASTGEEWSAVGGGESLAGAIVAARETLPAGPAWGVAGWNDLYGD
ncbi:MAG TPA: hypothetical protein VE693_05935 [Gaiellaceae bacterium]|nr:hypothetical protein [Gaiellaceae bacterium]